MGKFIERLQECRVSWKSSILTDNADFLHGALESLKKDMIDRASRGYLDLKVEMRIPVVSSDGARVLLDELVDRLKKLDDELTISVDNGMKWDYRSLRWCAKLSISW